MEGRLASQIDLLPRSRQMPKKMSQRE